MDKPTVTVRGQAQREVPPEVARFMVQVSASDADRQATLQRLMERVKDLRASLDAEGSVIERQETGAVRVWPETKRRGERVTAYHGSFSMTVTVSDFTALGDLMVRLADRDQTTVAGPWWSLRPDSPAYAQARREAIGDAVRRAREYAAAVGARIDHLLEISDDAAMDARPFMLAGYAGGVAGDEEMHLDMDPPAQTVHAVVTARFVTTEPVVIGDAPFPVVE